MTDFDHELHILNQAESLNLFRDYPQIMINMKTDEQNQTTAHYWGKIDRIVLDVPDPYVDIQAEKLIISYFTQAHRDAKVLFDALRAAREAVTKSESAPTALVDDWALTDAVNAELDVKDESQTIILGGIPQRIAIGDISMTIGVQSS
jgi:S-adenosylmethionine:diacylglycerol 3-amino-3-carboxypropyl transferase